MSLCIRITLKHANTIYHAIAECHVSRVACHLSHVTCYVILLRNHSKRVAGTYEERGMCAWRDKVDKTQGQADDVIDVTYELPYISKWLRKQYVTAFIPILPGFKGFSWIFGFKSNKVNDNRTSDSTKNTRL